MAEEEGFITFIYSHTIVCIIKRKVNPVSTRIVSEDFHESVVSNDMEPVNPLLMRALYKRSFLSKILKKNIAISLDCMDIFLMTGSFIYRDW
jgi:hypothetical protein